MTLEMIQTEIEKQLAERGNKVVNKNAISALFGAIGGDPVGALGKIFLGREDALDAERQRIAQDQMLILLCRIDEVLSQSARESTIVSGLIESHGKDVDVIVGAHVKPGGGPVRFENGTHIKTSGQNAKRMTGLLIGGRSDEHDD